MRVRTKPPRHILLKLALIVAGSAAVMALGAGTASAAGGLRCGDTITKDTKLKQDLRNCPGDGLVIGAANITLDLNGHTVDGDDVPADAPDFDFGVDNEAGHDGVRIKDGTVRDFEDGIELIEARRNSVREVTVASNDLDGLFLTEADHADIEKNSVSGNDFRGIVVRDSTGVEVKRNRVTGNDHAGIALFRSTHTRIEGNSVSGAGRSQGGQAEFGIELVDSPDNRVENNGLARHSENGIVLFNSDGNSVEANLVGKTAGLGGIEILNSDDNEVRKNDVGDNEVNGIVVRVDPDEPGTSNGNFIASNLAARNGRDGIFVGQTTSQTVLERNAAHRNGDDGIDVNSSSATITRNTANENDDLGIEAGPGVVDGGNNRAEGNGDPRQCTGVACS